MSDDLKVTGKVVILRDSDRVVNKWTLRLMYAVVFASALSGVLRLIGWVIG